MPYLPLCTTGICKHNTKSETWTFWTQGLRHTKPTSNVSAATKANCRVTSFKRKTSTFWTADMQTIVMIKQHLSTISHYFQSDKKLDILNELAFLLRFSSQLATQNALQHLPHSLFTKATMQGSTCSSWAIWHASTCSQGIKPATLWLLEYPLCLLSCGCHKLHCGESEEEKERPH